ncbi:MAG: DUF2069 domain-containing protein [Gammaproteobacteria bacterium]|jgi:uncharacterized membrane protein
MSAPRFAYILTLTGYLGTLALLTAWYGWLAPSTQFPVALVLLLLVVPLLFPLRGLLHGRAYTFSWSCFLALLYFTHGIGESYSSPAVLHLALLEVTLASMWFIGAIMYVRLGGGK